MANLLNLQVYLRNITMFVEFMYFYRYVLITVSIMDKIQWSNFKKLSETCRFSLKYSEKNQYNFFFPPFGNVEDWGYTDPSLWNRIAFGNKLQIGNEFWATLKKFLLLLDALDFEILLLLLFEEGWKWLMNAYLYYLYSLIYSQSFCNDWSKFFFLCHPWKQSRAALLLPPCCCSWSFSGPPCPQEKFNYI